MGCTNCRRPGRRILRVDPKGQREMAGYMKFSAVLFHPFVLLSVVLTTATIVRQTVVPLPATPLEPIAAILDAFRSHRIVALDNVEFYGNEQSHAFRLSLVSNPKFAATVNDIVVEFGNSRYQEIMDRFVRGEEIPYASLRQVWQNTTQPDTLWDVPIYEEFFRAVRNVNASLPRQRQLRVLLGDPPIDWDAVEATGEHGRWDRDGHPADLIQREVIAKGHRALVFYGDFHFIRKNPMANAAGDRARSLVSLLEAAGTKVFTIHTETQIGLDTLQPGIASWPKPSLALLRGTILGVTDFSSYYRLPLMIGRDGKPLPDQRRPLRMEEQFDAILYLGPLSTLTNSQLAPSLCSDENYMNMRLRRMARLPAPPGAHNPVDSLKKYCATILSK